MSGLKLKPFSRGHQDFCLGPTYVRDLAWAGKDDGEEGRGGCEFKAEGALLEQVSTRCSGCWWLTGTLCLFARRRQQPIVSVRCWPSTRRMSSSWKTTRSWPAMWVPRVPLVPARPCHPTQKEREPQNLYLQIRPWGIVPGWVSSTTLAQVTRGSFGPALALPESREASQGPVSGLQRAEFQALSVSNKQNFFRHLSGSWFYHLSSAS